MHEQPLLKNIWAKNLIIAFSGLFSQIYSKVKVPGQWLVSKTIPFYKNKGDKNDIENYRPISNLCLSSEIFHTAPLM